MGVMAAQLVHAAGESSPGNLPEGTHAVVLGVQSEEELLKLEQKLIEFGVDHCAIREPDAGWNNQLMSIGLSPTVKTPAMKKILSQLPLLR
jgi:hypothetical protein